MLRTTAGAIGLLAAVLLFAPAASAHMIKCKLTYDLEGWSFIYKYAEGEGRITCSNGDSANVKITTNGGGPTMGTQKVIGGKGVFSSVKEIGELYGTYAEIDAHAGAGGAGDARAMVKENANLSLAGKGQGISLGIAVGAFSIEPR